MKVYRILPQLQDFEDNLTIGKPLPIRKYNDSNKSKEKIEIEKLFEEVRENYYSECYPRQKDCFFVFGNIQEEKDWLMEMFSKKTLEYTLVTLEVEASVQWYNVYHYDDAADCKTVNDISKYAHQYWKSRKENNTHVEDSLYEGLCKGENKVTEFEVKTWNGLENKIESCNN